MKKLLVVSSLMNVVLAGSLCLVWRPGAPDGAGTTGEGGAGQARKAPDERSATGARAEAVPARPGRGAFSMAPNRVHRLSGLYSKPETHRLPGDDGAGHYSGGRARPVRRQAEGVGAASGPGGPVVAPGGEGAHRRFVGQESPVLAEAKPRAKVARQIQAADPSLPVAFLTVAPEVLKLTPEQQESVQLVRDTFLARVGGAGQDPNDPAYHERWQKAQPEADELLKAYIGRGAFQEYQIRGGDAGWRPGHRGAVGPAARAAADRSINPTRWGCSTALTAKSAKLTNPTRWEETRHPALAAPSPSG